MRVFTPSEVASHAANKYLGVLVAAKYARLLNEAQLFQDKGTKKLTTRALEELTSGALDDKYRVIPRRRSE